MDAYQTRQESIKLYNKASQIIDRALYLGQLGDEYSYAELMAEADVINAQAAELDRRAHELYRHEWEPETCACVTPEQSCPACRLAAALAYSSEQF